MRRLTAILLGLSVVSTTGQVSAPHVHRYSDHDHPEHHHGPAIHEHQRAQSHPDDGVPRWESCEPGQHAVSLALGRAGVPHTQVVVAECGSAALFLPMVRLRSANEAIDVRVHGPPFRTQAPPRAPPLILPA